MLLRSLSRVTVEAVTGWRIAAAHLFKAEVASLDSQCGDSFSLMHESDVC